MIRDFKHISPVLSAVATISTPEPARVLSQLAKRNAVSGNEMDVAKDQKRAPFQIWIFPFLTRRVIFALGSEVYFPLWQNIWAGADPIVRGLCERTV